MYQIYTYINFDMKMKQNLQAIQNLNKSHVQQEVI